MPARRDIEGCCSRAHWIDPSNIRARFTEGVTLEVSDWGFTSLTRKTSDLYHLGPVQGRRAALKRKA